MNLTTIARLKVLIGETTADQDAFLEQIVTDVSRECEIEMRRHAQQLARTEEYAFRSHERTIFLTGAPVSAAAVTIKESWTNDFTNATALTAGVHYVLSRTNGRLQILYRPTFPLDQSSGRPIGPTYFQVAYTGGMTVDDASFVAAHPDIAGAVDLQCVHLFRRKENPGGSTKLGDSAAIYTEPYHLLPGVLRTLARYKRRTIP